MTGRTAGQLGVNYPWTLEKRVFILPIPAVVTFDGELPEGNQEITAEFQLFTLCGEEGGDIIPAKLSLDQKTFSVSYYHPVYRTMRYFQIQRPSLTAGFVEQRDFRCQLESFDVSDRIF